MPETRNGNGRCHSFSESQLSGQEIAVPQRLWFRRAATMVILGVWLTAALVTPSPAIGAPLGTSALLFASTTKIGIDGDDRAEPGSACDVEVIANPAINDGAMRLLMSGRAPDPIESIMVFALQFSNSISAAAVADGWSEVLQGFGEHLTEFGSFLPLPAGAEYTTTVRRATIPDIGDRSDAVTGSIDLIDPAGQSGSMPFAGLTYQDRTKAYLLIVVSIPPEREPGAGSATPVSSDALVARLTEVVSGIQARSPGESVTRSPTLGHCVGGMFDVLPAPADMPDAEVIYEQQMVGSMAER